VPVVRRAEGQCCLFRSARRRRAVGRARNDHSVKGPTRLHATAAATSIAKQATAAAVLARCPRIHVSLRRSISAVASTGCCETMQRWIRTNTAADPTSTATRPSAAGAARRRGRPGVTNANPTADSVVTTSNAG
jgi:hypothetical protein